MARRPEDAFDEYFRSLDPADHDIYKGRKDLDGLPEEMRSFLATTRAQIMEALRNEAKNVPQHVDHPPFYFDYVESDIPNAIAFRDADEEYSFVGVTMPLLDELVATSKKLCASKTVLNLLSPHRPSGSAEIKALFATLVRLQLLFILSHEYAHHVNGHLTPRATGSAFANEILYSGEEGTFEQQVCEIDADGYATFIVLADLISGASRPLVVDVLELDLESVTVQDEVLFLCFVIAVGGFFFVSEPDALDTARGIYQLTHPPQCVRMMSLVSFAVTWCSQFQRSCGDAIIVQSRFSVVMNAVATATWHTEHLPSWGRQIAFLASRHGGEYIAELQLRFSLRFPNYYEDHRA